MMWVVAEYEASSLFSLKPASATASGGRTLLVPTPFAIKMALLDVVCRLEGTTYAQTAWTWLNDCTIALQGAEDVVVNNTFIKVLKPRRNPAEAGSVDEGPLQRTITYREYAYLHGDFEIAIEVTQEEHAKSLKGWLVHVNYLGKRGGFIQIQREPQIVESLPQDFIKIDSHQFTGEILLDGVLTQLDDTGDKVTFEQVDIYSEKRITLGKDRVLHHIALPYRLNRSSRHYSHYRRIHADE